MGSKAFPCLSPVKEEQRGREGCSHGLTCSLPHACPGHPEIPRNESPHFINTFMKMKPHFSHFKKPQPRTWLRKQPFHDLQSQQTVRAEVLKFSEESSPRILTSSSSNPRALKTQA